MSKQMIVRFSNKGGDGRGTMGERYSKEKKVVCSYIRVVTPLTLTLVQNMVQCDLEKETAEMMIQCMIREDIVMVPPVTLAQKVGPGLQDLQTRVRRILAERNAEKAEENTWIGRMVAAESIGELDGLIKSRAA